MLAWQEAYNCHTAALGQAVQLAVVWQKAGFTVQARGGVNTVTLRDPEPDLAVAKQKAVRLGRKMLQAALRALEAEQDEDD